MRIRISAARLAMAAMICLAAVTAVRGEELVGEAPGMLREVAPRLEAALGTKFKAPPGIRLLAPEAALPLFRDDLGPEVLRRYPEATPGQRRTLLDALAGASVRSSVARYSVSGKCLVLVPESFHAQAAAHSFEGAAAREFLLLSIAHEAVHALDDQEFDLAALYRGAADREALRAVSMVIEGRAVHFGTLVAKELGVGEEMLAVLPGGPAPGDRRAWTFRLTYGQGAAFTAALIARGGLELAARAMREPPVLTGFLFHPERWPEGQVDPRPARVLRKALPDSEPQPLSELELRARYCELDGPKAAELLLRGFVGGSQLLWRGTNLAVLAFDGEEAAERFLRRSEKEVPAARSGTLVARAAGPAAKEAVDLLRPVLDSLGD